MQSLWTQPAQQPTTTLVAAAAHSSESHGVNHSLDRSSLSPKIESCTDKEPHHILIESESQNFMAGPTSTLNAIQAAAF